MRANVSRVCLHTGCGARSTEHGARSTEHGARSTEHGARQDAALARLPVR
ncbi:succinylglutamate desuccinylase [Burkholderia pseudomallei]|nr:succinylglutamate desuccinylase [Burkholderia pseudomallei]QEW79851.1 succinylglutamate desuccinylase [Burkholderia pseudomallei]